MAISPYLYVSAQGALTQRPSSPGPMEAGFGGTGGFGEEGTRPAVTAESNNVSNGLFPERSLVNGLCGDRHILHKDQLQKEGKRKVAAHTPHLFLSPLTSFYALHPILYPHPILSPLFTSSCTTPSPLPVPFPVSPHLLSIAPTISTLQVSVCLSPM